MTKKSPAKAALDAPALFHPFDETPPEGKACMDRVYEAFAPWPIQWGWCSQCFGLDWERRMRAHADVHTAPRAGFDMIYYENPLCSGGEATFLHWLPRALEIAFFEDDFYPRLSGQLVRLGLLAWPEDMLAPLRQLLFRASAGWFVEGDPRPLQRRQDECHRPMKDRQVGPELISVLCVLRVDPRSIAQWLLAIDTPAGWRTVLDLLQSETIIGDPVYYVLPQDEWTADFKAAHAALDRRLRAELHRVF